jgi:hypothetical protein
MDRWREPIAGVGLEQYASIRGASPEEADEPRIARERGLTDEAWAEASAGWAARLADPELRAEVARLYVPPWSAARAARLGGEPASLERYARVIAEYAFVKDEDGRQLPLDHVLQVFGYDRRTWSAITSYWTPKVNDQADPSCERFRERMQAESDRIFGLERVQRAETEPTQDSVPEVLIEPVVERRPLDQGVVGLVVGWVRGVLG